MWLVLTEAEDPIRTWVARGLAARSACPVLAVHSGGLAKATRWELSMEHGRTRSRVQLDDGRWIDSSEVRGVVNRLQRVPPALICRVHPFDQPYAAQEWGALWISWLHGFDGTIINPPSPTALSGARRHPLDWSLLATRAGFKTVRRRFGGDLPPEVSWGPAPEPRGRVGSLWIVGERAAWFDDDQGADPIPRAWRDPALGQPIVQAAVRLAALAHTPMLGVRLGPTEDGCCFYAADPCPNLQRAGEPALDALAEALAAGSASIPTQS